jgi:hypothetical protein
LLIGISCGVEALKVVFVEVVKAVTVPPGLLREHDDRFPLLEDFEGGIVVRRRPRGTLVVDPQGFRQ